jgi:putative heme-binding domain-containing protein
MRTLASLVLLCALPALAQHAQEDDTKKRNPAIGDPASIAAGEKIFNEGCAGCHGPGGQGGRGPNLAQGRVAWHSLSDESTFKTIREGIPSGGMPPTPGSDEKIWQLTAYVRSLSAPAAESSIAGDVKAGEALFWSKGGCGGCHAIRGRGGKLGPDLSNVGGTQPLEVIRAAIREPGSNGSKSFEKARVVMQDGRAIDGVLKNRNNYSLQLLDASGRVHLIAVRDVKDLQIAKDSAMPKDIAARFTPAEFDNLIAFLASQSLRPVERAGN